MGPQLPPEPDGKLTLRRSYEPVRAIPLTLGKVEPELLDEGERGNLLRTWQILLRHKALILLGVLLGGALGFGVTALQTPLYRAHTSLEIQGLNDAFLNMRDTNALSTSFDLQTQVRALQSQSLRQRALASLKAELKSVPEKKPSTKPGWLTFLHPTGRDRMVQQAASNVTVAAARDTRIIDILCDSSDPQISAAFANTLTKEYIDQTLAWRWETGERTAEWLTRTLEDIKLKLQDSEQKLQNYAQASGLIFNDEKDTAAEDSLKHLQSELSKARTDRLQRQAQWTIASSIPPEHLPEVLTNGTLNQYNSQLTELRRQYADMTTSFTPAYPRAKRLQAQIAELEQAIERDRSNIINRVRTENEAALGREKLLEGAYDEKIKEVAEQAGRVTHYAMLKREVESNRRLYDNMLQKVKEAGIAAAMQANNVRVVDAARPPALPYRPRTALNIATGLITGLFLAIASVLVRAFVDRSIRRPGDARTLLNIPELGAIPAFEADPVPALQHKWYAVLRRNGRQNGDRVELATWQYKPSMVAESFRAALASILFLNERGERPKVIAVTSPGCKEGKTNVISNLGIALTEINRRVVLVDGDMRAPALHRLFNISNNWGLSDLLKQKEPVTGCPIEGLVRKTQIPNLYVLPSGPGTVTTSQLLYSPRTSELIERLREEFDAVLIDTPPMQPVPDARVLSRLADGVILVIRAGSTHREAASAAVQRFQEDGTAVLGAILNNWDPRSVNGASSHAPYGWDPVHHAETQ